MKPLVLSISKSINNRVGPGQIDSVGERILLRELEERIEGVNRPRVVLDCSELKGMGVREVGTLISCLERVMRRNGDVRLAGVSPRAREILSYTGAERLFRIYDSKDSAVRSFESEPSFEMVRDNGNGRLHPAFKNGEGTTSLSSFRYAVRTAGEGNESFEEEGQHPD